MKAALALLSLLLAPSAQAAMTAAEAQAIPFESQDTNGERRRDAFRVRELPPTPLQAAMYGERAARVPTGFADPLIQ